MKTNAGMLSQRTAKRPSTHPPRLLFRTLAAILATTLVPLIGYGQAFGPSPYLQESDSPFSTLSFANYFLEDFEDGLLNTLGVSANVGVVRLPGSQTDSVDGDDGAIDGSGTSGHSYASGGVGTGDAGILFTFDNAALGGYPTHAGLVYTDGGPGANTQMTVFDELGSMVGTVGPVYIADGSNFGETAEDRFIGFAHSPGIAGILIRDPGSFASFEVDHVQYGIEANSINKVLCLDGVDGWAQIPDSASLSITNDGMTVSAWVKKSTPTAMDGSVGDILDKGNGQPPINGGYLFVYDDRSAFSYIDTIKLVVGGDTGTSGPWRQMWISNVLLDDQWHHVIAVDDPAGPRIYYDGESMPVTTGEFNPGPIGDSTEPLFIGRPGPFEGNRFRFDGYIDEVTVWNRPLDECEIEGMNWRRVSGTEPGLVGAWGFNLAGSVVIDRTPFGNNGSMMGTAIKLAETDPTLLRIALATELFFVSGFPTTAYQVEYATEPAFTNWTGVGPVIYGNGTELSVFDRVRMEPDKIYRVSSP